MYISDESMNFWTDNAVIFWGGWSVSHEKASLHAKRQLKLNYSFKLVNWSLNLPREYFRQHLFENSHISLQLNFHIRKYFWENILTTQFPFFAPEDVEISLLYGWDIQNTLMSSFLSILLQKTPKIFCETRLCYNNFIYYV